MLRSVDCYLVADVSEQPVGPETSVSNHQSALRNITEKRRSNLHRDGNLISFKHPLLRAQYKLTSFYNRDGKCLLRGTNWVFTYTSGYFPSS